MVTALTSAFVIFDKNESVVLPFDFKKKVDILLADNLRDFGVEVFQSFTDALYFISGDTAGL